MGYLHINNLYKDQDILMFKECYAMEKIHGTSAHISYDPANLELKFFSGGESHDKFVALFDGALLRHSFNNMALHAPIVVYGEAYGGSQQKMSHTYGKVLKFIAFDVQIGDSWLKVPDAEAICRSLGIEFVHYVKVSTDLKALDAERDAPSVQAVRNGILEPRPREGVVLRPLVELTNNAGRRVICKHKGEAFQETATPRPVVDPSKMKVLDEAQAIANEWVTRTRLEHVLDKIPDHGMEKMRQILNAMVEDVLREGAGELVDSQEVRKAICNKTATFYKAYLQEKLRLDNPSTS